MKKLVISSISAAMVMLAGCADSDYEGQGGAGSAQVESDSSTEISTNTTVSTEEPGVAPEPGTPGATPQNESVESRFNTLGSSSSPSANVPGNVATNATAQEDEVDSSGASAGNEQGTQTSPEPETGDDANPDSVKPDER